MRYLMGAKKLNLILISFLIAVSLAVYINSLWGEFLIDDYTGILKNEKIHDLKTFFTQDFSIRPGILTELTRALIWQIGAGKPFAFHLFSVLLHASCVLLIFILCNLIFGNRAISFLAGLIFAVHPIHTEAVSWISAGPYVFSSFWFLLAVIFYIKADRTIVNLALSIFFFSLCLLTNNTVVALPIIFAVYDLFFRRKGEADKISLIRLRRIILSFVILIVASVSAMFFAARNELVHTIFSYRSPGYLIVAVKAFTYYLKIIYLPVARGLYHPFAYNTLDADKITPAFFVSLFIIAVSIVTFLRCRKSAKPLSFGIAWFFATYLPYSNIIPVCNIISERYVYLPTVGFSIILAYFFVRVWEIINRKSKGRKLIRPIAVAVLILFLSSYAVSTVMRNRDYRDLFTFWETNINNFPEGYMAYNNLAGTYYASGRFDQAISYSWINLMINPKQPHIWCNLGMVYREIGDLKQAKMCYNEALKVDAQYFPARKALEEMDEE
ncbi:hypothetical protein ACFL1K_01440 [Candidatus Omnitrophota bacterium]